MLSVGIIQARGGSKRLPRKNVKLLNGSPLVSYVIRTALASELDRVIVTTEDDEIIQIARDYGADVPFKRPLVLASDYASDEDILLHTLNYCRDIEGINYDIAVKLHPTTPFSLPEDINSCIKCIKTTAANCCFTAREVSEPPQWMFLLNENEEVQTLLGNSMDGDTEHTQLLAKTYFPTGAAYAIRVAALRQQHQIFASPLHITIVDAARSVDIDDEIDFLIAEHVGKQLEIAVPKLCQS